MRITFLGTGTSHGVPSIDCMIGGFERCPKGVCRKSMTDPKHRRTRCSILVEIDGRNILIDVSADFREQALRERVGRIDAVLITHKHADHIAGMPDIRSYTRAPLPPLPVFGSDESVSGIRQAFGYIFDPSTVVGGGIPRIELLGVSGPFELFGRTVTPLPVAHGGMSGCLGYRIGPVAYVPDIKTCPEETRAMLDGVDTLVLNCLRVEREHSTHLVLPESMALARSVSPRQCFFVHMCHDVDYETDSANLDPWMRFAWDGLSIEALE